MAICVVTSAVGAPFFFWALARAHEFRRVRRGALSAAISPFGRAGKKLLDRAGLN